MAIQVKIDRIITLEASERFGVINRLVRQARVINLDDTDYSVLFSALEEAGIPSPGAALSGESNLILVERNPRLIDEHTVDVNLVYEHVLNDGQDLDYDPAQEILVEGRAYVNQISSYVDGVGNPITVEYTYPVDDPDYPGQTKEQGVSVQVCDPQENFRIQGIRTTDAPRTYIQDVLGCVNSGVWKGGAAKTWMCTGATYELHDIGPPKQYIISFEFQYTSKGWNPLATFIDERTGRPPTDLQAGVGYKWVTYHTEVNFDDKLNFIFEG